ncbi:unnamed protein product [Pedinophyceae sp. YPF-701]|nr:unnamed protein product [Pedinophyceae sp. YPF-701]
MKTLPLQNAAAPRAAGARGAPVCRPCVARRVAAAVPRTGRRANVVARAMAGGGMRPELREAIDNLVTSNKVVVFIKGTKMFPQCGFSNTVVQILNQYGVPYEDVNVLDSEEVRSGMKEYSMWPTFPQVYIDGEFFGGCDIMMEAYQDGTLAETLERVMNE